MPGSYEVTKSANGLFRFVLKAGNGEVILTSESYKTKAATENAIASVRTNGPLTRRYEKKESDGGKPMFTLKAANGQVIGTSELYATAAARDGGITSVKAHATTRRVIEARSTDSGVRTR
jgi:uncharacterized protein